ncbi:MAG: hypothetical protein ABJG15_04020 [Hyphomonadaceae bacterium]
MTRNRLFLIAGLVVGLCALVSSNLFVRTVDVEPVIRPPVDGPFKLTAQIGISGAFRGVTSTRNINDPTRDWQHDLPDGTQARRSGSYPWAIAGHGENELWVGTVSEGWCVWPFVNLKWPLRLTSYQSQFTACSIQDTLSIPSQIIVFDLASGTQQPINEATLTAGGIAFSEAMKRHEGMSRLSVMALRAAGASGNLVFFAGHHLHAGSEGWLRIFVFNAKTRAFLGYREFRGDTARKFVTITDENGDSGFYTIIGAETGMTQNGEGPTVMLRWVGTEADPFGGGNYLQTDTGEGAGWDVVSADGVDGAYGMIGDLKLFTHIDGTRRLIMSSGAHPLLFDPQTGRRDPTRHEATLLLSNPVPPGGWTRDRLMKPEPVFSMERYDPDERGRWGAKWGTVNIHDGHIYFGSYHQGTSAGYEHFKKADPDLFETLTATREGHETFMINQWRATSIFRMGLEDLSAISTGEKDPDLLYGYEDFQVADTDGNWSSLKNGLGNVPLYGPAGLGHPGNIYSWTSLNHDGQLFWGFFDAFSGAHDLLNEADASRLLVTSGVSLLVPFWKTSRDDSLTRTLYDWASGEMDKQNRSDGFVAGGDLIVFEDGGPPRALTMNGFGNPCANGVRNAELVGERVFFATSSWCNLSSLAGLEFYEYRPELDGGGLKGEVQCVEQQLECARK